MKKDTDKNINKKQSAKENKPKEKHIKKNPSVFRLSEVVGLVLITMCTSLLIGCIVTYSLTSKKFNLKTDPQTDEIVKNYNYILENYYSELDKDKLVDGAIKGMISELEDEHSSFIDNEENSNFDKTLEGSYEGIGVEVYNDENNDIIVLQTFPTSSSYEAGIRSGDKIISIDNIDLKGHATSELSNYIASKKTKKSFQIVYERNNVQKKVTVKKKYIVIPTVASKTYTKNNKKIGFIKISQFSATTYNQFKKELEKLEQEKIASLVIDLRDNTGGHLSVVADMLSLMMSKKHVIYQIESKENTKKYYSTGKEDKKYPIVILQNENSASASELMCAALKEELDATVVGTASFGKGTVQELVDLPNGNEYKFTTKKWLTSKGNWIHKKGITPNVEVKLNEKYYSTFDEKDDNQLQKALNVASEK